MIQTKLDTEQHDRQKRRELVNLLRESQAFRNFQHAFSTATDLPLALEPADSWQLPSYDTQHTSGLCEKIASTSKGCAGCLRSLECLRDGQTTHPCTTQCEYGLFDSSVPLVVAGQIIAYLHTGQANVLGDNEDQDQHLDTLKPSVAMAAKQLSAKDIEVGLKATKQITKSAYDATVNMLQTFSEHLSTIANQIAVTTAKAEPPVITKAKKFIQENYEEDLSLGRVAEACHVSVFYFCKLFKRFTGLNFTDYLARVRIERAKESLLDPNRRISEVAYEVGFQSLTHFNRMFKKLVGCSPTEYRHELPSHPSIAA